MRKLDRVMNWQHQTWRRCGGVFFFKLMLTDIKNKTTQNKSLQCLCNTCAVRIKHVAHMLAITGAQTGRVERRNKSLFTFYILVRETNCRYFDGFMVLFMNFTPNNNTLETMEKKKRSWGFGAEHFSGFTEVFSMCPSGKERQFVGEQQSRLGRSGIHHTASATGFTIVSRGSWAAS